MLDAAIDDVTMQMRELIMRLRKGLPDDHGKTVRWEWITPAIAEQCIEEWMFENQRKLRRDNIVRLTTAQSTNTFLNCNPIWICELHRRMYIVNGQHTLETIIQTRKPEQLLVALHPVKSYAEVQRAYAAFDAGSPRTQGDITHSLKPMILIEDQYATPRQVTQTIAAMTWVLSALKTNERVFEKSAKVFALQDWASEVSSFWRILQNNDDDSDLWKNLTAAPVLAVILVSLRAFPAETDRVLRELVEPETLASPHVIDLFEVIQSKANIDWTGANRQRFAIDVARAIKAARTRTHIIATDSQTAWELVSENRLPLVVQPKINVDMKAAAQRKQSALSRRLMISDPNTP